MSYCVEYNPELKKRYPAVIKLPKQFPVRILVGIGICIVAYYGLINSGILRYLIPGDAAVTTAAFSFMVEEIKAGETVGNAVFAFCKEVVSNAS